MSTTSSARWRLSALSVVSVMLFFLPLVFSFRTEQVFAVNKYMVFLIGTNMTFAMTMIARDFRLPRIGKLSRGEQMLWCLLALFLMISGLSAFTGLNPARSFWGSGVRHTGLVYWLHLAIFAGTIRLLAPSSTEQRRLILLPILATGVIQSLIAIVQWFDPKLLFSSLMTEEFLGRAFGTLGHPSFLGQFMIFPIAAAVGLMNRRTSWIYVSALILCMIGLLLSFNRASFLGVAGGAVFLLFLVTRERRTALRRLTLPIMVGSVLMMALLLFSITTLFSSSPTTYHLTPNTFRSIHVRSALWRQIPAIVAERPLLGAGLENFNEAFSPHLPPELLVLEKPTNYPDSSHNVFFDLLVHTGLLGMIAFAGFLVSLFVMFLRQPTTSWLQKNQLAGIVSILISWQFGLLGIVDAITFFVCFELTLRVNTSG